MLHQLTDPRLCLTYMRCPPGYHFQYQGISPRVDRSPESPARWSATNVGLSVSVASLVTFKGRSLANFYAQSAVLVRVGTLPCTRNGQWFWHTFLQIVSRTSIGPDASQMSPRCFQMLPPKNCLGSRAGVFFSMVHPHIPQDPQTSLYTSILDLAWNSPKQVDCGRKLHN